MSQALTTVQSPGGVSISDTRLSPVQMVARRNAVIEAMQKVMKDGVDYGTIPGTPKPTLYKPGSEKILSMFNLAVDPRVEDLSTPDCIRYRVFVTVTHAPSGVALGIGLGEASSAESKYQWRKAVCQQEWDATPVDRRRLKWRAGKNSPWSEQQVRAEMDDVANTVLKMAKKRAQIDATLTCTAASDMFSQDIEDLQDAGLDPNVGETHTPPQTNPLPQNLQHREPAADAQRPAHPPQAHTQAAAQSPAQQYGAATISEDEAKQFWRVAINRVKDYKVIMDYLRGVHGVTKKDDILKANFADAMLWAEKGDVV